MRVVLYARVSTDKQAEKYGIPSQVEALRRRCQERGWAIVPDAEREAFVDDGYSGAELDRPALARLRELVRKGLVDVVLAYDPDRLSRSLSHLLLLADEFERAGVLLEFVTQEQDTSPEGKMFFAMKGAVAEYEKAKILERTARGRLEKVRQGKVLNPSTLPRWLKCEVATGTVEVDEEWAQVVRLAFSLFVHEGMTLRGLARRFQELGIPTPEGGRHWQPSVLSSWLRNPAAKGQLCQLRYQAIEPRRRYKPLGRHRKTSQMERPQEEWHLMPVPAVVPPGVWEAAQRRLGQNKAMASRNARRQYLVSGLLRCGFCGGYLTGWFNTTNARRYYRCRRSPACGKGFGSPLCPFRPVPADQVEAAVWGAISRLLQNPDTLREELGRRNQEGSPTREMIAQELCAAQKRLQAIPEELNRLVEGYGKGLIPDELMTTRVAELQVEQKGLEVSVADLERRLQRLDTSYEQEARALDFAERLRGGLELLDFGGRRELLRLLVEDVTCTHGRVLVRTIIPVDGPPAGQQLCTPARGLYLGGFAPQIQPSGVRGRSRSAEAFD